jgi:hypothetical protein
MCEQCVQQAYPKGSRANGFLKVPTPKQINEAVQSALKDCDPAKMTTLFSLLAKNDTWQVPTLVQGLLPNRHIPNTTRG